MNTPPPAPSANEAAVLAASLEMDFREVLRDFSPQEIRERVREFLKQMAK